MSGSQTVAATSGTRDPSQIPFASNSVFNLPLGLNAHWQTNAQLSTANVYVNTVGNYNENIWTGKVTDPLVTVTNNASWGGTPGTFHVHIPVGAVPAGGTDRTFSVDDTSTHTWYSFCNFYWTGTYSATVSQGSGEPDNDSGITVAHSNWDQGVGTLRQSDLQAGTINHMLRLNMPTDMLKSYSQTSTTILAPYAWPQTEEDGFALNGHGGPAYSGTIYYGVTIGIPANAVEPAAVKANAGANMLWHELRNHGAMIRDSGGSGNTTIFQADQNVNPNSALIQGMDQYGAQIMAQAKILTNQGPNSINGGGTPIVPLDPPLSDAQASPATIAPSQTSTTDNPKMSGNYLALAQAPNVITVPASQTSVTVDQSNVSVAATSGNHMVFISGSGDTISLSGGSNTITDTGHGNTYVLPQAGNGTDSFTSDVLTGTDAFDLRPALAATTWDGSVAKLGQYVEVTDVGHGATVSIAPTAGSMATGIATIDGATTASLTTLLTHALT
jgi:hypothetical protein